MPETAVQTTVRELTFGEAIREAIAEEMRRDARVCIIGEDVAEAGTPFKVLSGLVEEFGKQRVIDTPISEPGFTGIGVGAAMTGLRPVVDIMFLEGAHGLSRDDGRDAAFGGAAFAIFARLAQPYSGPQSRVAVYSLRRQGPAENRHPRR